MLPALTASRRRLPRRRIAFGAASALLTVSASYALPVPLGFVGLPRFIVTASASRRIEWTP